MPDHQHSTQTLKGHVRTKVTLRQGEVISLCRCWKSEKFPLCDGSHKDTDNEKGPVVIDTDCDTDFHERKNS